MAGVDYTQYKGKPFQVVSKLGVRYTGIFDHISQEDQTICLAQVYNHGTEDRPTARKLPGSTQTLGWVRFHTESIESLALVENYIPPGEEAPIDPILASVSQAPPPAAAASQQVTTSQQPNPPVPTTVQSPPGPSNARHNLPPRPSISAQSAATAMDRVSASMSNMNMDHGRPRRGPPRPQAPEVPDAEFDFSKGVEKFEKERQQMKQGDEQGSTQDTPVEEVGELEASSVHPAALANGSSNRRPSDSAPAPVAYKKSSFFDGLSSESSRVSRNEERHRNYDTFGEAGGNDNYGLGGAGGMRGGRGGYGPGYNNSGGRGGFNNQPRGAGPGAGFGNYGGYGGRGGGGGGSGGGGGFNRGRGRGGYGQERPYGQYPQQRQQQEDF